MIDDHGYEKEQFQCAAMILISVINDNVTSFEVCDSTLVERGLTWREFEAIRKQSMEECEIDLAHQQAFPGMSS